MAPAGLVIRIQAEVIVYLVEIVLEGHWGKIATTDFFLVELWTRKRLTTFYVLIVINLKSRAVTTAGIARISNEFLMAQSARGLLDSVDGFLVPALAGALLLGVNDGSNSGFKSRWPWYQAELDFPSGSEPNPVANSWLYPGAVKGLGAPVCWARPGLPPEKLGIGCEIGARSPGPHVEELNCVPRQRIAPERARGRNESIESVTDSHTSPVFPRSFSPIQRATRTGHWRSR